MEHKPQVVKLSKTIKDMNGNDITEITLRPPRVEDVNRVGFPNIFGKDGSVSVNTAVISEYIMRLGSIPKHSLDSLDIAPDYLNLTNAVASFFSPAQETSETS